MENTKKILIVDVGKAKGGIERLIYNIYMNFSRERYHFDFLIFNEKCAFEDEYIKAGSVIYKILGRRKNPILYNRRLKSFFIKHQQYDFIWIQSSSASNISAHIITKKYTKSILITHAHVTEAETINRIHYIITNILHERHKKKLGKITDIVFGCSQEAIDYLFGSDIEESYIIKNGIDLKEYVNSDTQKNKLKTKLKLTDENFILGHVGRFAKIKNHQFIIKVFDELCKLNENAILLLVGSGKEYEFIVDTVEKLGISKKVIFLGEQEKVAHFYSIMDAFIFPSIFEGFGIAVIEAQTAGIKCYINENLPNSLDATDLIYRLSLDEGVKKWAKSICDNKRKDHCSIGNSKLYLYDICVTVKQIEKILDNFYRRERLL